MTDDEKPIDFAPVALDHAIDNDDFYADGGPIDDGPASAFHRSVMDRIETRGPAELQAIYFEAIERGPLSLVKPIEDEFNRRGLDRYAEYPAS